MIFEPLLTIRPRKQAHPHTRIPCVIFDFLVFYVSNFRFVVMMTKLHFWIIGDNCYKRLDTLCRCTWMSCWKKKRQIKQKKPKSLCFLPVCAHLRVCMCVIAFRNMITLSALEFGLFFNAFVFVLFTRFLWRYVSKISRQASCPSIIIDAVVTAI